MNVIILIISAILTGALVKFADSGHRLKIPYITSMSGVLYGIGIGFVVSMFQNLSSFWTGMVLGVLFSGKIDKKEHFIGLITGVLTIFLLGYPNIDYKIVLIVIVFSILEEWINDNIAGKIKNRTLNMIIEFRPVMEIVLVVYSIILQDYQIFLSLLCFDIGYIIITNVLKKS
jgi:ABC-type arginine transport system permease subunit